MKFSHTVSLYNRSLSDVHNNKKSSLKPLIECFPKIPDNSNLLSFIMVPPTSASQGLTHEQVMPFLKKLENGQEREGNSISTVLCRTLYASTACTNIA